MVFWRSSDFLAAARDYEQVIALRPHDYVAWLDLGSAREKLGDPAGASEAYRQAIRLAPFYAEPYWELGEALLQMNRKTEAFAELRRAVASEPGWIDDIIDLANEHYGDEPDLILRAVQPQRAQDQLKLAQLFLNQGYASEALTLFKVAGQPAVKERQKFLSSLLDAERFREGFEIWSEARRTESREIDDRSGANITDGSFEHQIDFSEIGFGWRSPSKLVGIDISQDRNETYSGAQCLHLNFHGKAQTVKALVSQLVLLEPEHKYQLSSLRERETLLPRGLPEVDVLNESGESLLSQTVVLPPGTSEWNTYHLEFKTTKETKAGYVILRRRPCATSFCPIFGHLWLDSFSLQRL
ncbi:MAG: tetratricopeptide repeat protein [Pyrinomonadaceae bacterium]